MFEHSRAAVKQSSGYGLSQDCLLPCRLVCSSSQLFCWPDWSNSTKRKKLADKQSVHSDYTSLEAACLPVSACSPLLPVCQTLLSRTGRRVAKSIQRSWRTSSRKFIRGCTTVRHRLVFAFVHDGPCSTEHDVALASDSGVLQHEGGWSQHKMLQDSQVVGRERCRMCSILLPAVLQESM